MLAPPLQRLVTELAKLPGVGQRTAQRLAFHILRASPEDAAALAEAIRDVKEKITLCEVCFNLAEGPRCTVCLDERREADVICVVEEPGDVIPIERTHEYRGRYHVLGGALSPIDGVDPEDLRIRELVERIDADGVVELVIATNPTMSGEATALHLADLVRGRVRVTRLASGLPVGADLEHADGWTGSNYAYNRALGELSAYRGVAAASVLAGRLRAGWIGPGEFELLEEAGDVAHPQKRFFAGGSNSVRGFAQSRLGPKVLTVSAGQLLVPDTAGGTPACTVEEIQALTCDA